MYSKQHYVIKLSVTCEGRWFSPGTTVSFTDKTDRHDITAILLKVALNTITITFNLLATHYRVVVFNINSTQYFHSKCTFPQIQNKSGTLHEINKYLNNDVAVSSKMIFNSVLLLVFTC